MSKVAVSREFKRHIVTNRGRDREVRVPQFPKMLVGDKLKRALGAMAYKDANGDRDKAIKLLRGWLEADFQLKLRVHQGDYWDLFCRESVDDIMRATRAPMRGKATAPTAALSEGIRRRTVNMLMEFRLRRGVPLGDATRPFLLEEATDHEAKGTTMMRHGKWCRLIAKELADDKTKVRDVLKESDLQRFQKQSQKDVA